MDEVRAVYKNIVGDKMDEKEIEIPAEFSIAKIDELLKKFPDRIPVYDYKKKAFILKENPLYNESQ